jgi:hypothetical protein
MYRADIGAEHRNICSLFDQRNPEVQRTVIYCGALHLQHVFGAFGYKYFGALHLLMTNDKMTQQFT